MSIRELRSYTGLSQNKFAAMFGIPASTIKDWEHGRRKPPQYVINMIQEILEYRGIIINTNYIADCEKRQKSVERALAIIFSATNGPDKTFMNALNDYIEGKITLSELEQNVDSLSYLHD